MVVQISQLTAYFLFFIGWINYENDVIAIVSCLFIVMCFLFIVMIENADDDLVETKPIFVDNFRDVTPFKVEAKPNIDGASILYVETSLDVDSSPL